MRSRTECFAARLREVRRSRGLTQRMLGERLGFSEKTVSKWECGAAIPDIETLFSICEQLETDLNTLFSERERYFLGIDGGGTKTALLLLDEEGREVRSLCVEGCNPVDIGVERACGILRGAIHEICAGIPLSSVYAFAGIAGGTTGGMREQLHDFFETLHLGAFENDSDNRNIIAAGLGECDGITVVLGTGFCIYTQREGTLKRLSGWGYLLDDGGSGFNLGRDALHAYFAAYDGTGEETLLSEEIERICPGGESVLIGRAYTEPKRFLASLAPAVIAARRRGDAVADRILQRNMRLAADLIAGAARPFGDGRVPVVLAGGLTEERDVVECLASYLSELGSFDVRVSGEDPVYGAALLAMRLGGMKDA